MNKQLALDALENLHETIKRIEHDQHQANGVSRAIEVLNCMEEEESITEVIERMEEFKTEYERISESSIDYFGGKAETMGVAIAIVKAALLQA